MVFCLCKPSIGSFLIARFTFDDHNKFIISECQVYLMPLSETETCIYIIKYSVLPKKQILFSVF